MKRSTLVVAHNVAILTYLYMTKAFISADVRWLHDVWSWSAQDRFWLLYVTTAAIAIATWFSFAPWYRVQR